MGAFKTEQQLEREASAIMRIASEADQVFDEAGRELRRTKALLDRLMKSLQSAPPELGSLQEQAWMAYFIVEDALSAVEQINGREAAVLGQGRLDQYRQAAASRRRKWAATIRPLKVGDVLRWGSMKATVRKIEPAAWNPSENVVTYYVEGRGELRQSESLFRGGQFKLLTP